MTAAKGISMYVWSEPVDVNSAALDGLCWLRALLHFTRLSLPKVPWNTSVLSSWTQGSDAQLTLQSHKFDWFAWACSAKRLLLNGTLSTQDTTSSVGIQRSQRKRLAKKTLFTCLHYFRYLDLRLSLRGHRVPRLELIVLPQRDNAVAVCPPTYLPSKRKSGDWFIFLCPEKNWKEKNK